MENLQEPVIQIRDLRKSYSGKAVLKGVNLTINRGQIIGYIGPNGSGKSTTVKIMLGLIDDYEGEVRIYGDDIRTSGVSYKKKIGYVPEIAELYDSLTAREYLLFIGQLYGLTEEVIERKALQLLDIFMIESAYSARISSFSKGMKQKLMLVASLIHNPDILFLDEPLSGLDANSVIVVKEILSKLASEGKTIFYSSHIMEVVEKISSRILLLNNGEIVADGSFKELTEQNSNGTLEQIFNELTGFDQHESLAAKFVSIIQDGDGYARL